MQRAQPWPCTRNLGVLRLPRPRLLPVLHTKRAVLLLGGREEEKKTELCSLSGLRRRDKRSRYRHQRAIALLDVFWRSTSH